MPDFLLELLSEEIPARMQRQAAADLERLFTAELAAAGLAAELVETLVTPRRLALIASGLPAATDAVSEELKGPRSSAPAQALEGFLRKTGLTQDQLEDRGGVWFAVVERSGRESTDVLAAAVKAAMLAIPWPKSMRWGASSSSMDAFRWVRPLQGIVALFGGEVVPIEIAGIASGRVTFGHRFMSSGEIEIDGADDYAAKLRAAHVIVSSEERATIIAERAAALAADAGLALVPDDALAIENAGLTEWPVPLLGRFDPAFLDVPPEVVQLTMRTNQKYFAVRDTAGKLAPAFVCTANIEAADGSAAIVAGNEKVLAARLSDARFFWEQDRKKTLEQHAEKLKDIVFHEKLGTVADKVDRIAKLARWLVESGVVKSSPATGSGTAQGAVEGRAGLAYAAPLHQPSAGPPPRSGEDLADLADQAARLCKADLITGMVGEFPELQGIMGGHYARAERLPAEVADAIRDHYKPVGQGDKVPTAPVTVAVSLADKLDTLCAFFRIGEAPTGSRDPFALRRAAIGAISLIVANGLRFRLGVYLAEHMDDVRSPRLVPHTQSVNDLKAFLIDRLKVQQREAGIRHDVVDAVAGLLRGHADDLVQVLARVKALQAFIGTDDGANLLVGYKRAANILKAEAKKDGAGAASTVIPAKAGTQETVLLGPGLRRDDGIEHAPMSDPAHQGIPQTGEEDPLVLVDDPLFAGVVADLVHESAAYTPEPAEAALTAALAAAEPKADAAIAAEDFEAAMAALASLRAPIDAFFDSVTVNDADANKRASRLALLERVRAAVHRVADFSRIEG